ETRVEVETTNFGPITMVVDNLAEIAVNVSDETSVQLQARMDRTAQEISGNMEVLTTDALAQLSDVIFETNQLLVANPDCNAAWSLDELNENVTAQLSGCTDGLGNLLENFVRNGEQSMNSVRGFVQQIAEIPAHCQLLGVPQLNSLATAGANICFINAMAEINLGMAQSLHNASLLLVQTRRATEEQVMQAQLCSGAVVQQIADYLREEQDQCQQ
ncbi:hypothetical protein KR009_010063, partial [Drosophila setifemur]